MKTPSATVSKPVVFFDGVFHLCNGFVDWVVARDPEQRILFAPLQGATAEKALTKDQRQGLSSVLVLSQNEIFEKSTAVLLVFEQLPGYRWTRVFKLVPTSLRDFVYDWVARNRYVWFGKSETCRLPTPNERSALLP